MWRAIELYLEYAPDLAPSTRRQFDRRVRQWERFGLPLQIEAITTESYTEFRRRALEAGLAPSTIETAIGRVQTLLRHCALKRGLLKQPPDLGRKLKIFHTPRSMPSLADLSGAYEAIGAAPKPVRWAPIDLRWRCWLVTAYNTALRMGDLFALRWEQVDFAERTLSMVAGKTGKHQVLPIGDCLLAHLARLREADPAGARLFPAPAENVFRCVLAAACKSAGAAHFTPHGVRRRAALEYELAHAGAGGLILGHTLRTTTIAHYVSALEVLREAAAKLPQPEAFSRGQSENIL